VRAAKRRVVARQPRMPIQLDVSYLFCRKVSLQMQTKNPEVHQISTSYR
jgi:hypothetical protein